jgi:hypothetical protein
MRMILDQGKSRDELFWLKVKEGSPDECWPWLAGKDQDGYGHFSDEGNIQAHRYAYIHRHKKQLDSGILICHHCDNPSCVNPNHLFEGTRRDNALDAVKKGRYRTSNNRKNWRRK